MKNLLSKSAIALMALASVVFTSCENKPVPPVVGGKTLSGVTTEVRIGMEIKGTGKTKATPEDLGLVEKFIPTITNVYVVPAVDSLLQKAIKVTDLDTNYSRTGTIAVIDTNTNRFLVYGNVGDELSHDGSVTSLKFNAKEYAATELAGYYEPYPLYFFRDTRVAYNSNKGYYAFLDEENDWNNALFNSGMLTEGTLGEKNRVKIDGVTYAVGSLVAAVRNGYTVSDSTHAIYQINASADTSSVTVAQWDAIVAEHIKIMGISVDNQPSYLGTHFESSDAPVTIWDGVVANDSVFGSTASSITFAGIYPKANPDTAANLFVRVAQEVAGSQAVTLNIKFKYDGADTIVFVDPLYSGIQKIKQNDEFYIAAQIRPGVGVGATLPTVFAPTYTTIVNAKITNWYKFTSEPQVSTDVELGIEVDVEWHAGNVYEVEI